MFNFFSSKGVAVDFSFIGVDMHSHLIPGIDDGAQTVEESISLIKEMVNLGYTKIITTPHVYQEYYPNSTKTIQEGFAILQEAIQSSDISIPVEVAAEYYIDDHFKTLLDEKDLLTLGNNFLLVEMSFFGAPPDLHQILFDIQTKGYKPILAHPERYAYYGQKLDAFKTLKERGCKLQLNLTSLIGAYGPVIRKIALILLKSGLIDFLGTDLHNVSHLDALKELLAEKKIVKNLEKLSIQNLAL